MVVLQPARAERGVFPLNGALFSRFPTPANPLRSRITSCRNQGFSEYVPSPANHICQFSSGWCGAAILGSCLGSPFYT